MLGQVFYGAQLSATGYPHFPESGYRDARVRERDICEGEGQVSCQNNYSSGNILKGNT